MTGMGGLPPPRADQLYRPPSGGGTPGSRAGGPLRAAIAIITKLTVSFLTAATIKVLNSLAIGGTIWTALTGTGDAGAQLNALFAAGYTDIRIAGGSYAAVTPVAQPPFTAVDAAWGTVTWAWQSAGTCWSWHGVTETDEPYGELAGITIDLSGETGASVGLDFGDLILARVDCAVRGPQYSADVLARLSNDVFFTEKTSVRLALNGGLGGAGAAGCTLFLATVAGAATSTHSLARCDFDLSLTQGHAADSGAVFFNGVQPYGGILKIRGNFLSQAAALPANPYSPANKPAVLTIAGSVPAGHPGAGNKTQLTNMVYDFDAEAPSGGANYPQTIVQDAGGNILNGTGSLGFGITGGVFAAGTYQTGDVDFLGSTYGDPLLCAYQSTSHPAIIETGPVLSTPGTWQSGGNALVQTGRFLSVTLSADLTIEIFGRSGSNPPAAPHWVVLRIQQSPLGGFTVTWPRPGSNGVFVAFANGVVPVMSAGPSAIDIYVLYTFDGMNYECVSYAQDLL